MSDIMYCRDSKLRDSIMSDPKHVLYDHLSKQRQRGACVIAAIILSFQMYALNVSKMLFIKRRLFQFNSF